MASGNDYQELGEIFIDLRSINPSMIIDENGEEIEAYRLEDLLN